MGGGSGSGSGAMVPVTQRPQIAPLHVSDSRSVSSKRNTKNFAPHPPPGLRNVGNTCFANAALQCLLSTPLPHALLDPKTIEVFCGYSSNLKILHQGSGEVDSDESSDDEDDIFLRLEPSFSWEAEDCNDIANHAEPPNVSINKIANEKRKRREARQKEREERRKHREKRDMIEKCQWVTRELRVITREYTRGPSSTDSTESSQPTARGGGFFSAWSYTPPVPPNPIVDPGQITRNVNKLSKCLRPYQQEDAHEFLRALLSTLIMDGHNKELSSLFDGLLESAITCKTCCRASLTRDRYMDLSLDINRESITSLPEALRAFTATETLDEDNMVNCDRCGVKRVVTKGLRLATAPTVLVCHLKRFAYDMYGRTIRLAKHVEFPLRLGIGDFMSRANRSTPPPYELVGVLVHTGRSCDSGHYLSFVKSGQFWYKCNDAIVTKVSVETVLEQRAYILMYEVAGMREKHGFKSFHRYHEKSNRAVDPVSPIEEFPSSESKGDPLSWTSHKCLPNKELKKTIRLTRSQSLTKVNHTPMIIEKKDLDTMSDSGSQGGRRRIGDDEKFFSDSFSGLFSRFCGGGDIMDNICNGAFDVNTHAPDETAAKVMNAKLSDIPGPVSKSSVTDQGKKKNKSQGDSRSKSDSLLLDDDLSIVTAMTRSISSGHFQEVERKAAEAYQRQHNHGDFANDNCGAKSSLYTLSRRSRSRTKGRETSRERRTSRSLSRVRSHGKPGVAAVSSLFPPTSFSGDSGNSSRDADTDLSRRRSFSRSPTNNLSISRASTAEKIQQTATEETKKNSPRPHSSTVLSRDEQYRSPPRLLSDKAYSQHRLGCLPPLHRRK
mmetsp:Transcript_29428/g.43810  ORF Transcript_29428/g.43810 Transcript_29428/m.43810 type:complete len:835 (-) Transcript_29428:123-2627(-)